MSHGAPKAQKPDVTASAQSLSLRAVQQARRVSRGSGQGPTPKPKLPKELAGEPQMGACGQVVGLGLNRRCRNLATAQPARRPANNKNLDLMAPCGRGAIRGLAVDWARGPGLCS